ncbi:MAG: hypothetical protein ACFFAN_02120 [Promethearchaeota archaeon]
MIFPLEFLLISTIHNNVLRKSKNSFKRMVLKGFKKLLSIKWIISLARSSDTGKITHIQYLIDDSLTEIKPCKDFGVWVKGNELFSKKD